MSTIPDTLPNQKGISAFVRNYPIVAYFFLAYAGMWIVISPLVMDSFGWIDLSDGMSFLLFILSSFSGPGLAAYWVTGILGQTRKFRALITEPDAGCTLLETDLDSNTSTSFTVWSLGTKNHARVTIMTVLKNRRLIEGLLAKILLTNVYQRELELLAKIAKHSEKTIPAAPANHHVHTATSK